MNYYLVQYFENGSWGADAWRSYRHRTLNLGEATRFYGEAVIDYRKTYDIRLIKAFDDSNGKPRPLEILEFKKAKP